MVGGSVNGRPFREDPTSYSKTGIPCGNPRRFASRGVVRMVPNKHAAYEDQRLDMPPSEKTETEGERQFKRLLDKQLNKTTSVEDVMKQKREFKKSFSYQPVTEQVSGKFSLDDFKQLEKMKDQQDHLQQCGLDDAEMKLHLQTVQLGNTEKRKMNPDVLEKQLVEIEEKIQASAAELEKPFKFRDLHHVSRHEMEIEKSLKPNSTQAHIFKALVTTEKAPGPDSHPEDPINHLKQLESDLFDHLREGKRKRRKRKKLERERASACTAVKTCRAQGEAEDLRGSKVESATAKPAGTTEVGDSAVKRLTHEEIRDNRLSVEEIVQMPRFQNYQRGEPSHVLYIKNLARNIEAEDLEVLFGRFADGCPEPPTVKLMCSRMRGQAFVTFSSQEVASEALDLVNGYKLKGKPLIVSFGKHDAAIK